MRNATQIDRTITDAEIRQQMRWYADPGASNGVQMAICLMALGQPWRHLVNAWTRDRIAKMTQVDARQNCATTKRLAESEDRANRDAAVLPRGR